MLAVCLCLTHTRADVQCNSTHSCVILLK
uniref:Uncharacterized protein n=1 Tax=Anguilla anguilla TaxID=7936 RepID=A0A0E9SZ73_ANGAN